MSRVKQLGVSGAALLEQMPFEGVHQIGRKRDGGGSLWRNKTGIPQGPEGAKFHLEKVDDRFRYQSGKSAGIFDQHGAPIELLDSGKALEFLIEMNPRADEFLFHRVQSEERFLEFFSAFFWGIRGGSVWRKTIHGSQRR